MQIFKNKKFRDTCTELGSRVYTRVSCWTNRPSEYFRTTDVLFYFVTKSHIKGVQAIGFSLSENIKYCVG